MNATSKLTSVIEMLIVQIQRAATTVRANKDLQGMEEIAMVIITLSIFEIHSLGISLASRVVQTLTN